MEPVRKTTAYRPQTTSAIMARITAGVDPWAAYRDFLEDWSYIPEARTELVTGKPTPVRREDLRWASCAELDHESRG